jgi:competence protein CoiA
LDDPRTDFSEKEDRRREAEEFGCHGLVGGWARRFADHRVVSAFDVTKQEGPFFCPDCYSDAIVRKCIEKRDHFAHEAPLSPAVGGLESQLHLNCKEEMLAALKSKHADGNWAIERPLPAKKKGKLQIPELRPDISGRVDGDPLVIEVQASAMSISQIIKRTTAYANWGISMLWIVPLKKPLGAGAFRPRLYERYFHAMYFGRTYYWWPGMGTQLLPVHYGTEMRHIPYSEWYEQGGELVTVGGYDKAYKAIKRPEQGPPVCISADCAPIARNPFVPENKKKTVPTCLLWFDGKEPWWSREQRGDATAPPQVRSPRFLNTPEATQERGRNPFAATAAVRRSDGTSRCTAGVRVR